MNLMSFPEELLLHILAHCSPTELVSIIKVSKNLKVIAEGDAVWRRYLNEECRTKEHLKTLGVLSCKAMFAKHPATIQEEYVFLHPVGRKLAETCEREMDSFEKAIELTYQALESPMHSVFVLSHRCFWQVIMRWDAVYWILEIAESCSEAAECFFSNQELAKRVLIVITEILDVVASSQKFPEAAKCLLQNQELVSTIDNLLSKQNMDVKWKEKTEKIANLEEKPYLEGAVKHSLKSYCPCPLRSYILTQEALRSALRSL